MTQSTVPANTPPMVCVAEVAGVRGEVDGVLNGVQRSRPGGLEVREAPDHGSPVGGGSHGLATLSTRLPQLVRHPAVVAAVTVAASYAMLVLRRTLAGGTPRRTDAVGPAVHYGYVIHRVYVEYRGVDHSRC